MSIHPTSLVEEGVRIEGGVMIGAHVRVPLGVTVGAGSSIADGVKFGSTRAGVAERITIGRNVHIGAGAIVDAGVTIGDGAMVTPGSVILSSVPPNAVVQGNPATIVRYVDAASAVAGARPTGSPVERVGVGDVTVHELPLFADIRGSLSVGEFGRDIPFLPKRYFMVFDVPSRETRGEHAHRECHQFLICVGGSCAVVVDDGFQRAEIMLEGRTRGVHLPPMTWGIQYKYTREATLLVFASHHYDAADYIRDYEEFRQLARASSGTMGAAQQQGSGS